MGEKIEIELEDLRALFDVIHGTMDFGSGFFDTDDVDLFRRIALMIGVDPKVATPDTFARQFVHDLEATKDRLGRLIRNTRGEMMCAVCCRPESEHTFPRNAGPLSIPPAAELAEV